MNALELAPTETDIALANGTPPPLVRYDPNAQEPEFLFEVINDFIVRKTVGAKEIRISAILYRNLSHYVSVQGLGQTFAELGYDLPCGGPRRKPDVSFLSESRWPSTREFPPGDFVPTVPELAVEVISPHELAHVMFAKLEQYFRAGASAVWLVIPHVERVYCYDSPTAVRILTRDDELIGDPAIPGFRMPVAHLFPTMDASS